MEMKMAAALLEAADTCNAGLSGHFPSILPIKQIGFKYALYAGLSVSIFS